MDNNNSQSFGDLQPTVCLLRAVKAVSRPSEYWFTFDMPQKVTQQKQTCLLVVVAQWCFVILLIKLSIGSENFALLLCV